MSWFAQVGHIMRKDLREGRRLAAIYVAIVALATAHALRLRATSNDLFDVSMFFVVGMGVFVVASMVQADSPTRSDAFWATRPFHPSAMLGAKLFLALIIVAAPALLGQFVALSQFDPGGGAVARLLGRSAYAYAIWLIVSMVVGALTRDLRSFVVAIIAIPLVDALFASAFSWFPSMSVATRIGVTLIGAAGGLVLLTVLYRTRDTRRQTKVAGFVVVTCAFYSLFGNLEPASPFDRPAAVRDIGLRVEVPEPSKIAERSQVHVILRLENPPPGERTTLIFEGVRFHLRNGNTLQPSAMRQLVNLFTPLPPTGRDVQWLDHRPLPGGGRVEIAIPLSDVDRQALRVGVTGVTIEGTVIATVPRLIATLPLRDGASAKWDGARVEITLVGHNIGDTQLALRETSVRAGPAAQPVGVAFDGTTFDFALLNAGRNEARVLYKRASSGQSGSLVLPGIELHDATSQFHTTEQTDGPSVRVDDAWMLGASLVVADWVPRSRYSVRAEASFP